MLKVKNHRAFFFIAVFLLFSILLMLFLFWPRAKKENTIASKPKQEKIIEKSIGEPKHVGDNKSAVRFIKKHTVIVPDTSDAITQTNPLSDTVELSNNTFVQLHTSGISEKDFSDLPTIAIPDIQGFKNKEMQFYEPSQITNIAVTGVNDFWSLVKRPFNIDKKDSYRLIGAIGGTLLLTQLDETIQKEVIKHPSLSKNLFTDFGDLYGQNNTTYTISLSLTSLGLIMQDKELVQTGLEVFESYLIANNLTSMLKKSFGRARPFVNKGNSYFTPFTSRPSSENSFPSGHATLAFSLSTVLASHVDNTYLKILIYTPAVVTVVSRVMQNVHWTSDVFMGSAIGYFVGAFVTNSHMKFLPENMLIVLDQSGNIGFALKF